MKKNFTRARALYSNVAECADELTFTKGDILTVTDKEDETGWWECTNSDGASGWVLWFFGKMFLVTFFKKTLSKTR